MRLSDLLKDLFARIEELLSVTEVHTVCLQQADTERERERERERDRERETQQKELGTTEKKMRSKDDKRIHIRTYTYAYTYIYTYAYKLTYIHIHKISICETNLKEGAILLKYFRGRFWKISLERERDRQKDRQTERELIEETYVCIYHISMHTRGWEDMVGVVRMQAAFSSPSSKTFNSIL